MKITMYWIFFFFLFFSAEGNDSPPVGVDIYDIPNALSPTAQNIGDISLGGGITSFMNGA